MIIAVDVTPAAVRAPTGVAVYLDRLARALPAVDPETTYLSCYRLFRLWRRRRVPVADLPNARRALFDERLPSWTRPRCDLFHGADIRLPRGLEVPLTATVHDLYSLTSAQLDDPEFTAKRSAQYRDAAERAALLFTHSEHVRREVIARLGVAPARVRAVPLGVDASYGTRKVEWTADVLRLLDLTPGGYVLSTGMVSRRKNPLGAVRALARMRARGGPALRLVFAGKDHDQAAAVRAEAARLGLGPDAVRLLGYVPPDMLPFLYGGARALLFLSLDEGFGLPVLEAYASGAPVVAARRGAIPEVAGEGAAWLVEPEEEDAAAEALLAACAEGRERERRIEAGRARAAGFTWEETARRTAAGYREALGLAPAPPAEAAAGAAAPPVALPSGRGAS